MITREQGREIGAVAVLGAALFVLLALLPASLFAGWGAGWLPPDNLMGMAGATLRVILLEVFGVTAFVTPALI
ncbi:MAG TPA: hypothetical protein VFQ22_02155, partial [Longimicrobiales bacterium]|nr:hypothetical protein [Longimicrobiales bacterium]